MEGRVKIVLDADVLIHFSKAGRLSQLPDILPVSCPEIGLPILNYKDLQNNRPDTS